MGSTIVNGILVVLVVLVVVLFILELKGRK